VAGFETNGMPSLIPNAVEDALRLAGSVLAWRCPTKREVSVGGVLIPSGANVLLSFGAANRDPRFSNNFDIWLMPALGSSALPLLGGHAPLGATKWCRRDVETRLECAIETADISKLSLTESAG